MIKRNYSVLMSIYYKENPEFFKMSIESMMNQTLKPNEIVIVKDGKLTSELDEVITCYSKSYPKLFNIVPLENNVGLGKALNEGLKKCNNELVARMDTDDISLSERCELQVKEFINNDELSIVGTIIDEFYDNSTNIVSSRVVPLKHEEILKFSRRRSPFNHPSVMYKKSAVLNCGGYGDYRRNQDLDLFVRMLNAGYIACNINKSLLLFRANVDNFKRRKSWDRCKGNISIIYTFWKKGYSRLIDLIIITAGQIIIFISPVWLFKLISDKYLRKKL